MRTLLAFALVTIASQTQAQPAVITGRVINSSRAAIEGATVYINDLSTQTVTTPQGLFTMTVPAELVRGQSVNVRVRAVGYVPHVNAIKLNPGNHVVTFQLDRDPRSSGDERTIAVTEREGIPYTVAKGVRPGEMIPGQADPFARFLFPPELIMQHQGALELKESQREVLQIAIQEAQAQTLKMQWALAGEGEKLTKLLQADTLIEKEVLEQVDRILMTEREIKRAQMTLMIRIRNALTPAQQERLRQSRGQREDER